MSVCFFVGEPERSVAPLLLSLCLILVGFFPRSSTAQVEDRLAEVEGTVGAIFQRSCGVAGCHLAPVPQMDLLLTNDAFHDALVNRPSVERPELMRVKPGDPENSYLMMKIRGDEDIVGLRMPMVGDPLPEEEILAIEEWINLLGEVDEPRGARPATGEIFPFYGWKVINLPTTRSVSAGSWLFLIGHRFIPMISDGYDAFFGLDGSGVILMSMGYAFTDRLLLSLGRSNAAADVELQLQYRLPQQRSGGRPVGVGALGTVNWISERPLEGSRLRREALKFTGQVSLTHAAGERVGLAVVPGILLNPDEHAEGEPALITLGLGGRWRFHRNLSLVTEWVPVLSGFAQGNIFGNTIRFDGWGSAFEIATAGHVFQIVVGNSVGMASDQYLRGGDLDVLNRELRLGFNIFRILDF